MQFRSCGDCTACCDGQLLGSSYGNQFGHGQPCVFLVNKICKIYPQRPKCCVDYQCAWTQNLLPEHLRPDQSGVMVSVEQRNGVQFLKVIQMQPAVSWQVLQEIDQAAKKLNTFWELVKYQHA